MNTLEDIFGAAMSAGKEGSDGNAAPSGVDSNDEQRQPEAVIPTTFPMCSLAAFVMDTWRVAVDHRRNSGIDDKLRYALLAQTCQYDDNQKAKMRASGIDERIFAPITTTKVRAAKAMLVDLFNSTGEWPFTVDPTPDPEVPAQVEEEAANEIKQELQKIFQQLEQMGVQQLNEQAMSLVNQIAYQATTNCYDEIMNRKIAFARTRAKRMERKVQDIMVEGGWHKAFNEYVDYICTYGTGLIIGPVPRVIPVNHCIESKTTGARKYVREYKLIPTFEAVNPCDCYPAPDAKDVEDGPLCIRIKYTANELQQYVTHAKPRFSDRAEGWMWHTVRSLLDRYPRGGLKIDSEPYDPSRRSAENNGHDDSNDCTLEGVRCFASVRGSDLIEFGVTKNRDGKAISFDDFYRVETIVIGGFVVYCRIIDDRLGIPVSKGVFYELPGSWWGESIADKLCLVQSVMNNAIKSLMQNMAVASGPMYWINDVSRLADKTPDGLKFRPHKVFPFQTSMMGNSGAPMGVVSVPSNAGELLAVWEKMRVQADDDSGIPAYTYGQSSGQGALRTASGLAIFTEAASRGMKMVISTTDRLVTRDQVQKVCNYILLYDDDLDLKGDCEVHAAGVMGKILKAQQDQQRLQLFNTVIGNPLLVNIVGARGIMALLRPSIQDVNINPDDVIPGEEKLKQFELVQQLQQIAAAVQAKQTADQQAVQLQSAQGAQPGGGVQGAVPQAPGAQTSPETAEPVAPQGGVAERRGVA